MVFVLAGERYEVESLRDRFWAPSYSLSIWMIWTIQFLVKCWSLPTPNFTRLLTTRHRVKVYREALTFLVIGPSSGKWSLTLTSVKLFIMGETTLDSSTVSMGNCRSSFRKRLGGVVFSSDLKVGVQCREAYNRASQVSWSHS